MIKKMKRVAVSLLLVLCLLLTACDPVVFSFDYKELRRDVIVVELIKYDNPDVKEVLRKDEILPFDFDKMEIIETLELEQYEMFLYDISNIDFHICGDLIKYLTSGNGIGVRIIYENGNFVVICINEEISFAGEYNKDGSVGERQLSPLISYNSTEDYISFVDIINTYFDTKTSEIILGKFSYIEKL